MEYYLSIALVSIKFSSYSSVRDWSYTVVYGVCVPEDIWWRGEGGGGDETSDSTGIFFGGGMRDKLKDFGERVSNRKSV